MSVEEIQIDRTGRKIVIPTCPKCRSDSVEATENYRMNGSAKVQHSVTLDCPECGFNRTYSKGMT